MIQMEHQQLETLPSQCTKYNISIASMNIRSGVFGLSLSNGDMGANGLASGSTDTNCGVYGETESGHRFGIFLRQFQQEGGHRDNESKCRAGCQWKY